MKLKVNGSWTQFVEPLRNRETFFTHGALFGLDFTTGYGQLPALYRDSYQCAKYVVYSYETPIAWLNEDDVWIVPDVKYSVTTSKHQGKIFTAISQL